MPPCVAGHAELLSESRAGPGAPGGTKEQQQQRRSDSPPRRRSLEAARAAADAGMSVSTGFGGSISAVSLQAGHDGFRECLLHSEKRRPMYTQPSLERE